MFFPTHHPTQPVISRDTNSLPRKTHYAPRHFCRCYLKASKISKWERDRVAVILGIVRGVLISLSKAVDSDLSRPPGGYNPQFSCDTPTIWSSKGLSGGVYGGVYVIVMEGVINVVKNWHEPIYLLYETNNAQNLVILFSGILLKLLPPDVIFCS